MKIVMSSGHALKVPGANAILDEVTEARDVVEETATWLRRAGHSVKTFHDDVSENQQDNLETIVAYHNAQVRDLDISVHFNANAPTEDPVGTECLYLTEADLASRVSATIAEASGLIDRGAKYRDGLYFLNNTAMPAILIEVCFVDSVADATLYQENFERICESLGTMAPYVDAQVAFAGKASWFGGPDDTGVDADEGLAFLYEYEDAPQLFLPSQPPGTTGLARRLDPSTFYVACRWDYDVTPKEMLADRRYRAMVRAGDKVVLAWPADWGPHEDTGRVADVSPAVMDALGIGTDDDVAVLYPATVRLP